MSDVNRDICVEPELFPVVMSTDAVEPLAVPVVALTRSRDDEPLVVARPVNVDVISRAAVYPDLLSGRVMKSVDPDVGDGDLMSLEMIPGVDGDACHVEWREMVLDDVMMEKFVLVPEVCPVNFIASVAEPTFLLALSEVYSPVFLAGGSFCGKPPGGGGVRYSVSVCLPVESDTARVSALPVVGIEVPAVCFGKVALDSVRLRVGLSCFRLNLEETRPALLDERGVTRDVDLGVTPDGRLVEGAPVLEPLEHSVLEKSLDGGFTEGVPILEPLEHLVLGETPDGGRMVGAPVLESIEHSVPEKALDDRPMAGIAVLDPPKHSVLDVNMNSLWMAPWDAGGTFWISSRPEMVIHRDRLRWVVQLSCRPAFGGLAGTCVIDLYAGVSTPPPLSRNNGGGQNARLSRTREYGFTRM